MYTTDIYSVFQDCAPAGSDQQYWERMMHRIPPAELVQREEWILGKCCDKDVLHFGAMSGSLNNRLVSVASKLQTIDRDGADFNVDLDHDVLPEFGGHVMLLADVLEHLGNPLRLLEHLRKFGGKDLIVTVPNCNERQHALRDGWECVNAEHVAWYSWRTLKTVLERAGWTIIEFAFYYRVKKWREGIAVLAR